MASNDSFQNSSGYTPGVNIDDRGDDGERSSDPASSSFFGADFRRHDDLKEMLDSTDDRKKLEAMKRIIGMVAKGKDVSVLFPAVVKNVVCKNIEVKKLVYVYLTRYAEEQQDLALLSIATFQRSMKDPNQLIRASALRVLSSIRIPVIVPIMMLVIKDGVSDMSPYVRKAAAHAIPKLYSVDPDQKEELISFLDKLLADKTTLVIGSAIQAFEELCPERIDLIHKNYRKLCSLLADVEEWGQVIIINMLTRYSRTQFLNPNQEGAASADPAGNDASFYSSSNEDEDSDEDNAPVYTMDQDHRMLLRSAKPLLNSRNAAVVMAVVQLYYHCAPKSEISLVARAMIRLLRSHKEVQFIVLSTIATMSLSKRGIFEPYIKSFYIRANDPGHIKTLKLDILTSLVTEANVSIMMREFQQYVLSSEKDFASATIQAIGRIAMDIPDIADSCLGGLISLLSNKSDAVVGESVVVIKKLLQMKKSGHKDVITHLAQILDQISLPNAKSSILWLIGEYCDKVPKIAPDVLRKAAKAFTQGEDIVKLQTLNMAAKLRITNAKQTQLLCQYVFNLAKYDQSYDIRDRARLLRALILPAENAGALAKHAKKIFLGDKPAPVVESRHKERDQYQLGSLSHSINSRAHGYNELPDWPEVVPDPSVRIVEKPKPISEASKTSTKSISIRDRGFYSSSSAEETSSEEETSDEDEEDDDVGSGEEGAEESEEEESGDEESETGDESEEYESEDESSEKDESSEESEDSIDISDVRQAPVIPASDPPSSAKPANQTILDLFDMDDKGDTGPSDRVMQPLASPTYPPTLHMEPSVQSVAAVFVPTGQHELLNRMNSDGLHVTYRFTRAPYIYNNKMVAVELTFTNHSEHRINNIHVGEKRLQSEMSILDFNSLAHLEPQASSIVTLGIDYNDTMQPACFDLNTSDRTFQVKLKVIVGELLHAVSMTEEEFKLRQGKLSGMNETLETFASPEGFGLDQLTTCLTRIANVGPITSSDTTRTHYAASTLSAAVDVLITIHLPEAAQAEIKVNCEKIVIGSMLVKEFKTALSKEAE